MLTYPPVFENMRMIAEAAGATMGDCLRLVVYVILTLFFILLSQSPNKIRYRRKLNHVIATLQICIDSVH